MKSTLLLIISLFLCVSTLSAEPQTIYLQNNSGNKLHFLSRSDTDFDIAISIGQLQAEEIATPWGIFSTLMLPEFSGYQLEIGQAKLPAIHKLIDIPYEAEVDVKIISFQTEEIALEKFNINSPVLPYQGPIEKTEEAVKKHQFRLDKHYYHQNAYQGKDLVVFEEVGNLRGHRLGVIKVNAIDYLPSQNKLKIFKNIRIRIQFKNANLTKTEDIHRKYQSPYFSPLLKEFVINYENISEDLTRYPVYYVVIYDDAFANTIEPLINWKVQKGFQIISAPISNIGNSTNSITNYIQNLYNGVNPPSFILLVGDREQITTYSGQTGSHVSDLYYTTMTPGDFVPDIYIGRLSAQSESQLAPQIDKILTHEKYLFPQTLFLNHGSFAATSDGGNYTIAEGTHNYVINTHFIPNNLLYDKLYAITFGATGQDVINAVNDGRFILNYSGHGSTTSWGGPSVNQSMVRGTTNNNMYPFVISNACLTGSFEVTECFGETWVRKANGGSLAFTGASNSTYWDEDDEWERRAYDGVFWEDYYSLAAFVFRGNLAVLNAGYGSAQYYFEVYHLFGDPSVMLYWGEAPTMTVNASNVVFIGSPVYDLTVLNEDSAFVSLSMDGINYGTALTDVNGQAQVQLNPVPTTPGNMILTVTKFNRQPYIDTLQVIPASGPYLYCLQTVFDDQLSNNNGIPEAGESVNMSIQLANVGVADAENVLATISTTDTMVTILSGQSNLGTIMANDTVNVGEFSIGFSINIPHLHNCTIQLHMQDNSGNNWDQTLYILIRKGGKIAFSDTLVTFPNTFLNFSSLQNIDIINTGPDTLQINDITSNLPEFSFQPTTARITPGCSESFTISFTPQAIQLYEATITVYNNDPMWFDTTIVVSGTGIYAPDIAFDPDSISRQLNVTDSMIIPIQIRNEGLGDLIYNTQISGYPNNGTVIEGSGGADNFGHIWIDSDEPGGPDFQWIDITQNGTEVTLTGNNTISEQIPLGFTFPFYGQDFTRIRACTNGWLSLSTFSVAYNNVSLPSILAPRSLVAPLWDDLNFTNDSKLYFQQETNKAIFLYENVYRVTGEGPLTFEAILYENGNIILQYLTLENIVHDYTVGIQNQDATDGLTVAYNETYLQDSLAIIISKHSWASVSPLSGILAAQTNDTLLLTLKTNNFPMGEFWASIQIESNDPDEAICYIPIHITVDSITVNLETMSAIPQKFELYQNWPNPFNPSTNIKYALARSADVRLDIFNVLGQRIKSFVSKNKAPGLYNIRWDGKNDYGQTVASGIYIYRLQAGNQTAIRKMVYMR